MVKLIRIHSSCVQRHNGMFMLVAFFAMAISSTLKAENLSPKFLDYLSTLSSQHEESTETKKWDDPIIFAEDLEQMNVFGTKANSENHATPERHNNKNIEFTHDKAVSYD